MLILINGDGTMLDAEFLDHALNKAIIAAQLAGQYILDHIHTTTEYDFKGRANVVTEVDRTSERIIIEAIQETFPDHEILAEESPHQKTRSPYRWIIDPLDGTTNYIHGFPCFSVSIALEYQDEIIVGVVFDPVRRELFSAIKGQGAYLNRTRISVSKTEQLSEALLATGFPYRLDSHFERNMQIFKEMYASSQGVRRAGSAAIDLCYTACGRYDGFWEYDLNPWDVAAGYLIVMEAGGKVTDFAGASGTIYGDEILATNGRITTEMLSIINS